MKVVTLGFCCKNSKKNHENVVEACKQCGVEDVSNIADTMQIVQLGVMRTPAVMIDGKVVSMGRVLTVDQAVQLINQHK